MAQLKNTTVNDTGFLQLPVGPAAQRPTPAAGQMRFNTTLGKAEFYNATAAAWLGTAGAGVVATGGTVYDVDTEGTTFRVHVFTTTGNSTFTVSKGGEVEYLIVAGGGGGGGWGGGGGAGGVLTGTTTVTPQAYTITVGVGGARGTTAYTTGGDGGSSSAFGLTAIGGGGGGAWSSQSGRNGGSGGGGSGVSGFGLGTAGQGNNGGAAPGTTTSSPYRGQGGGGGAGSPGQAGNQGGGGTRGGDGGIGLISFLSGTSTFYAGGGGGHSPGDQDSGRSQGGLGGGGRGGRYYTTPVSADDGTTNTGGGGGGSWGGTGQLCGLGGSGIVIIRYPLRQENPVTAAGKTIGDALVLDLDFAKPTVYAGTGTVVTDSRLNGIAGTLVSGPVFTDARTHSSSFSFNGSNSITVPFHSSFTFNSEQTIIIWMKNQASVAARRNPYNQAYGGGGTITHESNTSFNYFYGTSGVNAQPYDAHTSPFSVVFNETAQIAITRNVSQTAWYKNGALGNTRANSYGATVVTGTSPILIGTGYTTGVIGPLFTVQVYNRALTAAEITQNYNATRWRFGV